MTIMQTMRAIPFVATVVSLAAFTSAADAPATAPATRPSFRVGHLDDPHLSELSGLVPCHRHPGLFWGHNDSGNPAELFALTRDGHVVARVPVEGARNVDWEDIATDEQHRIYVADTGNNNLKRRAVAVYRFDEPDPEHPAPVRPTASWVLTYPGRPFDCESLFIFKGYGYVMPKLRSLNSPMLYRFPLAETDKPVPLQPVGVVPAVSGPVTAADLSADSRYLAVLTVLGPYVLDVGGDPARATAVAQPVGHATFVAPRIESVCFVPEGLLTATEEGDLFLFSWADLGMKPISP